MAFEHKPSKPNTNSSTSVGSISKPFVPEPPLPDSKIMIQLLKEIRDSLKTLEKLTSRNEKVLSDIQFTTDAGHKNQWGDHNGADSGVPYYRG